MGFIMGIMLLIGIIAGIAVVFMTYSLSLASGNANASIDSVNG
jgi:hypothetical protein